MSRLKQNFWVMLILAPIAAAVPAGCGGDSDGEASALSKAQFVKQAGAICAKHSNILAPIEDYLQKNANSDQSPDELTADAVRQTALPQFQAQVDEIRELGAPEGDEEEVGMYLSSMQQAIDSLSQRQEVSLLTDIDEAFTRAKLVANSYGLDGCL